MCNCRTRRGSCAFGRHWKQDKHKNQIFGKISTRIGSKKACKRTRRNIKVKETYLRIFPWYWPMWNFWSSCVGWWSGLCLKCEAGLMQSQKQPWRGRSHHLAKVENFINFKPFRIEQSYWFQFGCTSFLPPQNNKLSQLWFSQISLAPSFAIRLHICKV